jgi:small basic protein
MPVSADRVRGLRSDGVAMNRYLRALLASATFVIVLLLVHYIHARYFDVDVVLYAAILDAVIAVVVTTLGWWASRQMVGFTGLERSLIVVIWAMLGYSFAISVPTVIDRSLSFYILEKLDQRGGGIQEARMGDVFTKEYMVEHHLVDIRLTEQMQSGTIAIRHGCVLLTEKGRRIAEISRFYRTHFLPKHRLIMGGYTDALTDPFRNSQEEVDYKCN